ncbi:MAG: hypothetical protein R2764_16565 [Bacteroidales bacterium]
MNHKIGVRHEDKYVMERRVAITPQMAKNLLMSRDWKFWSKCRRNGSLKEEFEEFAGAKMVTDLSPAPVIFGVKEMPLDFFEEGKTYMFFSHVY